MKVEQLEAILKNYNPEDNVFCYDREFGDYYEMTQDDIYVKVEEKEKAAGG